MKPRSSSLAAATLVLGFGCSSSNPSPAEARRPGPEASPVVAAAGPRVPSRAEITDLFA